MSMYMTQGLHRAMQQNPERLATVFGGREQTYRQYGDRVARLAAALQALGMERGDRIGMMALNSDRYLEFYFGVWWGGGAVNPVNIRWSPAEVAYSLDDCQTHVLLVDDQFAGHVAALREKSTALQTVIYVGDGELPEGMLSLQALLDEAEPVADCRASGGELAGVFYTGGTTGFPKGVMLSHMNLAVNAFTALTEGLTRGDGRALLVTPMFHIAAAALMNGHAMAGGTFVVLPMFTPAATLETLQNAKITHVLLVPTMIQMVVDHPGAEQFDLSSVELVVYGASVISEGVLTRAMKLFSGSSFAQAYGMTELAPIATILPPANHVLEGPNAGKLRSAGRATTICEVRVVDLDDNEAARGTIGEVAVRGPGVMLGYWNQPGLTEAAIRDGWMHTGDMGVMDDDGFVTIVDRLKDMIVSGGENVYSAEVENALAAHPAVAASAVIGIPSEQWGEAVHAEVVLKAGQTVAERELIAHCHALIANYKCPRSIGFREALPVSGAGKVLKTALREPFWSGQDRQVS